MSSTPDKIYYLMGFFNEEPLPIGPSVYDPANLHLTYLDKFTLPGENLENLKGELWRVAKLFWPIKVEVGSKTDVWGSNRDIPVVNVLDGIDQHSALHLASRRAVLDRGGFFLNGDRPYSPHLSHFRGRNRTVGRIHYLALVSHDGEVGQNTQIVANFQVGMTYEELLRAVNGQSIGEYSG
jgi:2'-5' RNA ligase